MMIIIFMIKRVSMYFYITNFSTEAKRKSHVYNNVTFCVVFIFSVCIFRVIVIFIHQYKFKTKWYTNIRDSEAHGCHIRRSSVRFRRQTSEE